MTEQERQIIRAYNAHRKSVLRSTTEPRSVRILLIAVSVIFMSLFLFVPLVSIFYEAFKSGAAFFFRRCECEQDAANFSLDGLDEGADYRITVSDEQRKKTEKVVKGSELMQDLRVESAEKMSSVLLLYEKA